MKKKLLRSSSNKKHDVKESENEKCKRYNPNPLYGLSSEQAEERKDAGLTNIHSDDSAKTVHKIILSNIFSYFNLIFIIMAIILIYEGSYNNLTFLVVVTANTLIGIVQEIKAKRTLDKLKIVSEPEITAIRGGKAVKLPSRELVLDDVVILQAGQSVSADGILLEGEITVNESLVTGEADEIKKAEGDTILSGSFVVSGTARARLDKVGDSSFAAELSRNAKAAKKRQQPGMMRSLSTLIKIIGVIIIPFAAIMFYNQHYVLSLPEKLSVENTAASVIGMIPEGLYLLTSVALAASTIRLAQKKTLVHDMKCIETLARVDVLCVDKTGTITEPGMQIETIEAVGGISSNEIMNSLQSFVRNMSADSETIKTLKKNWGNELPDGKALRIKRFSSQTKYSAADFGTEAYVLGAPEALLTESSSEAWKLISAHASQGSRVLLFGTYLYERNSENDIFAEGRLLGIVKPMGIIVLSNSVRPEAEETFNYFKKQNVAIKVISGDNPVTAALAASRAGINDAENYVDASELSKEALVKSAGKYTVFGRVSPEQKRIIIKALKKQGHTVAMTGDGVNDVLALKDADCGIAMASGSDAAANAADLVLLNSDFSAMPHIVAEGRRVINNIQRSATLFLSKNIFSFILSLISLISVSLYPLKPSQISVISALMIGLPSFFLALEPNEEMIRGKFLRNVLYNALPASLTAVLIVQWTLLMTSAFDISPEVSSGMCFLLYAFSAYLMLYYACRPLNLWHGILFALMGVLFIASVFVIPEWVQLVPLSYESILLLIPMLLLTLPLDYTLHFILEKLAILKERIINKLKMS